MSAIEPTGSVVEAQGLTPQQLDLIKSQAAVGATDDELAYFLHRAKAVGLDPLSNEIFFVKRKDKATIQTGIDGLRKIAHGTGEMDGYGTVHYYDPQGDILTYWISEKPPSAVSCTVWRKGHSHPYVGIARYGAYVARDRNGNVTSFWQRMPDIMLAKCAEAMALRKAFPGQLGGLYVTDEMHGGGDTPTVVTVNPHPTASELERGFSEDIRRSRSVSGLKKIADKINAVKHLLSEEVRSELGKQWLAKTDLVSGTEVPADE